MEEKLREIEETFLGLEEQLADPKIASNPPQIAKLSKKHSDLEPVVRAYRLHMSRQRELAEAQDMLRNESDDELKALAREEITQLQTDLAEGEGELRVLLTPRDPNDSKNVILEVRAGTGGEEAGLFASEILKMYTRYAENRGWRVEMVQLNETGLKGIKEAMALIEGDGVFSRLKYESGVHRVQRVPVTEAGGRIHTSAVTVAILPEAEDVDVEIDESDLRVDRYCSSGPGGQSVNTTYSAIRITHEPSGLVVTCQDEKSQHKNKAKALRVLRSRLMDQARSDQQAEVAKERRAQVGSGDRSEKIRTYNFPQGRVSDHRVGLTLHRLSDILLGDLDEMIDALVTHFEAKKLQERVTTS